MKRIVSKQELRSIMGGAAPTTPMKIHRCLNGQAKAFIEKSPLLFISTSDLAGHPTVSPKGDLPGFVRIENSSTLLIPERNGNRLLMGLQNLLENTQIGLLFMVPGTNETLRVHGKCSLFIDEDLCNRFIVRGRAALLVLQVEIAECFFHCGKALLRGEIWNPVAWPARINISFGEEIAANLEPADESTFIDEFDGGVEERYKVDL